MNIIVTTIIYYSILLALYAISLILAANEAWKRAGLYQSLDDAHKTAEEMDKSNHWTVQLCRIMFVVAFFYYCIPVATYTRFVRHNDKATLSNPRGCNI